MKTWKSTIRQHNKKCHVKLVNMYTIQISFKPLKGHKNRQRTVNNSEIYTGSNKQ